VPPASVIIVAYHSGEALTRCLDSLAGQEGVAEVLVIDNGDGGPEIDDAAGREGVRVITSHRNLGFAAGCNLGARESVGEVLVFLNPDTVVALGAIAQLARALEDRRIGIVMARLRLLDRPQLLNSRGTEVHVSGIAWAGGYGEPAERVTERCGIAAPSGSAMALRAETFWELGGFTEELFMYQEDLVLGWRARLAGLRVVIDPEADVYHDYEYGRNVEKRYLLERNRLVFLSSCYSGRLLMLLAPVLLSVELGMLALSAKEGWLREKLAGWAWLARNAGWLARHRRETQRLRRVPDRELAKALTPRLSPTMIAIPRAARAANPVLAAYWRLARRAL
jgi:GT2 family glycosyltransferase